MPESRRSARVDFDRTAVAHNLQLASLLRHRIDCGAWSVGRQIPTLDALTEECGIATAIVRKAIAMRITEGLLNAAVACIDRVRIDAGNRFVFMSTDINRDDVARLDFRQTFPK